MRTRVATAKWLIAGCLGAPAILFAQADRITGTIDAQVAVTRGILHPLAQPRYDQGPVEASFRLNYVQMMFTPSAAQQADLDRLLAAQQDPASPDFRKWLTPEQYADRFGLSSDDLGKIRQWLISAGFSIEYTARGRSWIAFSGTAAQAEAAFHATVHRYAVNGETHFAVFSDPLLPAAVAPLVATVLGLNDFTPKPLITSAFTSKTGRHSIAPGDIATIYDINPLFQQGIDGTGQRIVIVGQTDPILSDVQTFRSTYGLSATNIQTVLAGADPGVVNADLPETALDLEWAGAVAPGAQLVYVYGPNANGAAFYAIDQGLGSIISESYASCEAGVPASYAAAFETQAKQGNSQGITWLAGSGDTGAAACDSYSTYVASLGLVASFPASVPEITAVGGTEFDEGRGNYWSVTSAANGGSSVGYIPEMVWNDTAYGTEGGPYLNASGGGASSLYSKPSWQAGPGVPADGRRDLPDVSFAASIIHDYYDIVVSGQSSQGGGTSAATPVFAGMLALLNQYVKGNGLGNVNTSLYPLAASSPAIFHDIVTGGNIVPCAPGSPDCVNGQLGYNAAPGYDLATGLGSVDAYNLVTGWKGPSATGVAISSLSPASIAAGSPGLMLTVNGSNFASSAVVQWNGTALSTTFVSGTQLTASVSASLIALPGTAAIAVSSGATVTGPLYFTATAAPITFSNQRMTLQQSSSCLSPPPSSTFFTTDTIGYLYFSATVSPSDVLSAAWLAPDGTTVSGGTWSAVKSTGTYCFTTANLPLPKLAGEMGSWSARAYANGTLLFSIGFTVTCTLSAGPSITSVTSASSFGGYTYFASGSWLEIKGTNLADPADPRLSASVNRGQWTGDDFNGVNAPTALDGVSVSIDGRPAAVWYLSPGQLNVQAPEDPTTGNVSIAVTTCNATSSYFPGTKQALAPGLLAPSNFIVNGTQYMAATFVSDGAYVLGSTAGATLGVNSRPAKPGDQIIAYGVGFGDVTPSLPPGVIAQRSNALINPVSISFGSANATLSYAGLAGGFVGLYEFYITVPAGLANGDYQINVAQNGTQLPQTLYLTVRN